MPSARSRGPTSSRNGTPFNSQSVARRPKRRVDLRVELDAHAGLAQLLRQPGRGLARTVLVLHEQHDALDRREAGGTTSPRSSPCAMINPPTMRVDVPHEVVQHNCC